MKLYLTDLDGTLLDHKAEIGRLTESLMNALIDDGVAISYATARSVHSAEPKVSCIDFRLPVITHNGAFIIDPVTKERIVTHFFSKESKAFLKNFFYEHKESVLVYSVIDNYERVSYLEDRLNKGTMRYLEDRAGDRRMYCAKDYDELFKGDIYYITLIEPITSPDELDKNFYNKNGFSRNYQPDTYDTDEYWYEIYRDDVSKANSAQKLKEMVGADELIVFGDNTNDISMFSVADRCYAVSNATEQLKTLATGVIRSNEQSGVPVFIQSDNCTVWHYNRQPLHIAPDNARFSACTATVDSGDGVGILNEKQIHATLKSYFASSLFDKEVKIGNYFADLVTENGIFEIQTANFKYLVPKLNVFLKASHVTIVYPFHKKSRLNYIDKSTGEILKSGRTVTANDMTDFFLELYRIKQYLNDPNLTICIADIAVENLRYCAKDMKRRKTDRKVTVPTSLLQLTFLEDSESYRCFIPDGLPETFTLKEFRKCMRSGDASLAVKILQYVGVIDFVGKKGNEYIYKIT